jgi:hypothetical protein
MEPPAGPRFNSQADEIDALRRVQLECAAAVHREGEWAMLGVNDFLIEELLILYWRDEWDKHSTKVADTHSPRTSCATLAQS